MPARKYTEEQRLEFMGLIDRGGSVRFVPRRSLSGRTPTLATSG